MSDLTVNDNLYLFDTDSNQWLLATSTCTGQSSTISGNQLTVPICHLTQFALFRNTEKEEKNSKAGVIAGSVIGAFLGATVLITLGVNLYKKYGKREYVRTEKQKGRSETITEVPTLAEFELELVKGNHV